jgi:hypothetical protein
MTPAVCTISPLPIAIAPRTATPSIEIIIA